MRRLPDGLIVGAHQALAANRLDGLTVPNRLMFGGAYLWDLALISKGVAVDDPGRAAAELGRYLEFQWGNGLLPNEVYHGGGRPWRRRLFGHHPDRPEGPTTSGITQPPTIVRSAFEVGKRLDAEHRSAFYRSVFPKLRLLCRWVVEQRLGRNGLAVAIHPYETGMDNRIDLAEAMAAEWLGGGDLVRRTIRRVATTVVATGRQRWGDLRTIPVDHRSSHDDVLAAYLQTRHIRQLHYDLPAIEASGRGLLVEDVGYNAILVDAFACLQELATEINEPDRPAIVGADLVAGMERVAAALEDLWHQDPQRRRGGYYSRDYRTGRLLLRPTVAGLFPLLVSRLPDRVADLTETLVDPAKYWTYVAPPSAPVDSDGFAPDGYWRGSAWSFTTDILETALELRANTEAARELRRRYLFRPHGTEHAEYENPITGEPLGARPFSPAAALTLRLAEKPT